MDRYILLEFWICIRCLMTVTELEIVFQRREINHQQANADRTIKWVHKGIASNSGGSSAGSCFINRSVMRVFHDFKPGHAV